MDKILKSRISLVFVVMLIVLIPLTLSGLQRRTNVNIHAVGGGATISITPSTVSIQQGQTTTVTVDVASPTAFNAAGSTLTISSNLTVQSINTSTSCNMTFVPSPPTVGNTITWTGGMFASSSLSCTAFSLTVLGNAVGAGTIAITNGSVIGYADQSELFSTANNAIITINGSFSPSSTPTPTSILTPTPLPPTLTPTPTQSIDTIPPTVAITNPLPNSIVKRTSTVTISANATDDTSVSQVQFSVNGTLLCTVFQSPYRCSWSVSGKPNIKYTLSVTASDPAGNSSTSVEHVNTSH